LWKTHKERERERARARANKQLCAAREKYFAVPLQPISSTSWLAKEGIHPKDTHPKGTHPSNLMDIPLKATHLNLRAIINKVHQWHHHQYINSKLHEEEEEEVSSKAVWLLFAAAVYWTTAAATQQSSLIELSLNTGLPKTFWLLRSMDSGS
jgi:hypothetical protein